MSILIILSIYILSSLSSLGLLYLLKDPQLKLDFTDKVYYISILPLSWLGLLSIYIISIYSIIHPPKI